MGPWVSKAILALGLVWEHSVGKIIVPNHGIPENHFN